MWFICGETEQTYINLRSDDIETGPYCILQGGLKLLRVCRGVGFCYSSHGHRKVWWRGWEIDDRIGEAGWDWERQWDVWERGVKGVGKVEKWEGMVLPEILLGAFVPHHCHTSAQRQLPWRHRQVPLWLEAYLALLYAKGSNHKHRLLPILLEALQIHPFYQKESLGCELSYPSCCEEIILCCPLLRTKYWLTIHWVPSLLPGGVQEPHFTFHGLPRPVPYGTPCNSSEVQLFVCGAITTGDNRMEFVVTSDHLPLLHPPPNFTACLLHIMVWTEQEGNLNVTNWSQKLKENHRILLSWKTL